MEIVMNDLTKEELMNIYNEGKNLTDKPIYIDFYADWWGPCRMFKQVLDEVSPEYSSKVDMYKVDIEKETDLAIKFGARALPYMVFIPEEGDLTGTPGALSKDQLKYYLDGLISK